MIVRINIETHIYHSTMPCDRAGSRAITAEQKVCLFCLPLESKQWEGEWREGGDKGGTGGTASTAAQHQRARERERDLLEYE